MGQSEIRYAGCSCGSVRYKASGDPIRVSVCHCKDCQRRTGSAFGVGCYFPRERIEMLQGTTGTFERTSDAGRWVKNHFCRGCGNTVAWETEVLSHAVGIAAGSFDDTTWLNPKLHVWADSAQHWTSFPGDAEVLSKSNIEQYRKK